MAFTGDLEHLHIVDIIQLIHTTRKSGIFSVRGDKGESRIIFSNGYIVGANHLNNKVRIGSVLIKLNAISREDLAQALEQQKNAGKNRKPLITTLIESGKLKQDVATRCLKKLIEITIVELIGWTKGTFTLDTEAISVSPECTYVPDIMDQAVSLDAQMVLMDALRVYDEIEHNRNSGKGVSSDEDIYPDVFPSEESGEKGGIEADITAEKLGLVGLETLDKKIPKKFAVTENFDPIKIHRQNIQETLGDFSIEEQDTFFSFLEKCIKSTTPQKDLARPEGKDKVIILFSRDKLIKHAVMTICKNAGLLVFATDKDEEFFNIIDECLEKKSIPILVFDSPDASEWGLSEKIIVTLRQQVKTRYPQISYIQFSSLLHYTFTLQAFEDGVTAVLPKPLREARKEMFIEDTIKFLETFQLYISDLLDKQQEISIIDSNFEKLRKFLATLRNVTNPPDVSLFLLQSISETFDRSITFVVRPKELIGEKAIGVSSENNKTPVPVTKLRIPLTKPSVFLDVIEKGLMFYGESDDAMVKQHVYEKIGVPKNSTILILPLKSRFKTLALVYGDFGLQEASPIQIDMLVIMANLASLTLENVLYNKHLNKSSQK
jgi:hypothetical protein